MGTAAALEMEPREGNQAGRKQGGSLLQRMGKYVPCILQVPGTQEGQAGLKIQADNKVQPHHFLEEKTAALRS